MEQVYCADTPLNTGPEVELQLAGPPERLHVGAPVGAIEPATPVTEAVKVKDWPERVIDCEATIESEGVALGTITESTSELANW